MDFIDLNSGFQVFLNRKMRERARFFASFHTRQQKARQVYLNSLAICAANFYLQCMQFKTSWETSDSYDVMTQALFNVSDLDLPGIGKLECRPVQPGEQNVRLPIECEERVGYLFIEIDDSYQHATLLGFVKEVPIEVEFDLNKLNNLENLLLYLGEIERKNQKPILSERINLKQWLENQIDSQWLSVSLWEEKLNTNPELCLRSNKLNEIIVDTSTSRIRRGKIVDLGIKMMERKLGMLVTIEKNIENEQEIDVLVQIHSEIGYFLPKSLKLSIIDEAEDICLQAIARDADNIIQRNFTCEPGEAFKVELAFGDAKIAENFSI